MPRRLDTLVIALCLLGAPRPAVSDSTDALARAKQLYLEGFFAQSLKLLEQAEGKQMPAKRKSEVFLYQGLCLHSLGKAARAETTFVEALRRDPLLHLSSEQFKIPVIQSFRRARSRLKGRIEVRLAGNLRLLLDGNPFTATSVQTLPIGRHLLEAKDQKGRVQHQQTIVVFADKTTIVSLPRGAGPSSPRRPQEKTPRPKAVDGGTDGRRSMVWIWSTAAASAAFLAAGIGLGVSGKNDHQRWLELDPGSSEAASAKTAGQTKMISANVAFGVSAALAITSLVLLLTRPAERTETARVSFTPLVGPVSGLEISGAWGP